MSENKRRWIEPKEIAEKQTFEDIHEGVERFRSLVEGVRDYAIILIDEEGRVSSWNAGAEAIIGYSEREILGESFTRFYPPEAIERGWPRRELEFAQAQGRFEDEGWHVRKDGSYFWANVVITPLHDRNGVLRGYSKITRDLTERMRNEEALRQSEQRFRVLVEGVRDYAIYMLDPEGYISSWNTGAERLKGYAAREIIGQHYSHLFPSEEIARGKPHALLAAARDTGRVEDEGWRVRKDGSRFWANGVLTALTDASGRLLGFAKVTQDMTDRRRMETLEESGRVMNEFLAMLGHELRNPLAPIRNAVAIVRERDPNDPNIRWSVEVIERQVTQLTRLVDDLLDVSRITSGKIALHKEPLDIAVAIERAVEGSRPLVESRGHRLEVAVSAEPLPVFVDLARITQAIVNLLDNSAKFTPEGGHIRVSAAREDNEVTVRVRDTGVGIPHELLGRVFDLFTQGDRSLDRSEGGLGIGLTLVRRVIELHGGTVEAVSGGVGKGSEFIVRLPLYASPQPDPPVKSASDAYAGPSRRVLVVDDNQDSVETMARLLTVWGHQVETAAEGRAALAAAERFRPDVVLLDLGLPGMSGLEVAEAMATIKELEDVILVAITGYGQAEDRRLTREVGFDYHLTKPVDPVVLQGLLSSMAVPGRGAPHGNA